MQFFIKGLSFARQNRMRKQVRWSTSRSFVASMQVCVLHFVHVIRKAPSCQQRAQIKRLSYEHTSW